MPEQRTVIQYRAVAVDYSAERPDHSYDRGDVHEDRDEAECDLVELLDQVPPFDDGWIEQRSATVSEWTRS